MRKELTLILTAALLGGSAVAQQYHLPDGIRMDEMLQPENGFAPIRKNLEVSSNSASTQMLAPEKKIAESTVGLKYFDYDIPDDEVNFFIFQTYGMGVLSYRGFIHGTTYDLNTRSFMSMFENTNGVWDSGEDIIDAGCMVGDEYWAFISESWYGSMSHYPLGIYKIDLNTGLKSDLLWDNAAENPKYNCVFTEMSYDPVTDYVYALQRVPKADSWMGLENSGTANILRFDPTNPGAGPEQVGAVDCSKGVFYGMACDNGKLYLLRQERKYPIVGNPEWQNDGTGMYSIDLEEYGSFTLDDMTYMGKINAGFLKIDYYQTMEFDHTTHTLWWAGQDLSGNQFFTTIDLKTLETFDELRKPTSTIQYVAMGIPYQTAPDKAPSHVKDLKYAAAENGVERVDFAWTNPNKNYQLETLTSLTAIKVYRDNELIATLTPTGIGQKQTWSDENMGAGNHLYKFVACNENGDGLYKERRMFVGRDVPGDVTDIQVNFQGSDATISWEPALRGKFGGWYDQSTLKFDVVRYPDDVFIARDLQETSINDHVDVFKGYSYLIIPKNAEGRGVEATSKIVPYGPNVDIPYKNNINSIESANMITVVDANSDGYRWEYSPYAIEERRGYTYSWCLNPADDYLITPPFNFDPNKKYELRFSYSTSTYYETFERIEVCQANDNTAESHKQNVLKTIYGYPEANGNLLQGQVYIEDPSKGNWLSIHAASDGNMGWIYISDFVVREYSATDLSCQAIEGTQYAYVNKENVFKVMVRNEGYDKVKTGKVVLFNQKTKEVLAQANAGVVEAGETKEVIVKWIPTINDQKINVAARVELEGDTYPEDNVCDDYVIVTVTEGEVSDWKTVLTFEGATGYIPMYTCAGYTHTEVVYTAEEVGLKNVEITGIAYTYDYAYDQAGLNEVPVEIYMATTDKEIISEFLPANIFKKCLSAKLDLTGSKNNMDATMMFDETYKYSGNQNLVIKLISDGRATPDNPRWHMQYEEYKWPAIGDTSTPQMRMVWTTDETKIRLGDQVPVVKIAYRTDSGIEGVTTIGAKLTIVDGNVVFEGAQEEVNVYDMSGKLVVSLKNANSVNGLVPGYYTVVAKNGANINASKVAIQ